MSDHANLSLNATQAQVRSFAEHDALERRFWRNWSFLVAMVLFSVIAMVTGVLTGLRERVAAYWPWAGTDTALMIGLSLILLAFTAYLTQQQRRVIGLRRKLQSSLMESDERVRRNLDRILSLLTVSRVLAKETDPQSVSTASPKPAWRLSTATRSR